MFYAMRNHTSKNRVIKNDGESEKYQAGFKGVLQIELLAFTLSGLQRTLFKHTNNNKR